MGGKLGGVKKIGVVMSSAARVFHFGYVLYGCYVHMMFT